MSTHKIVIARYQFSSDIVETLLIYYFMLLEYMYEVSKVSAIHNPRKLSLKKKLKKWLNTEFSMLCENWLTFYITVNKYLLPLEWNFFVRLKSVLHNVSQHLEAIDHSIPEIKIYNHRHLVLLHKYTWILWQNYTLWHRKRLRIWRCFYNCHTWSSSRILTRMIKIILDSYMRSWCLSPIKYGTTHDNYRKLI